MELLPQNAKRFRKFNWDKGNIEKSLVKHNVTDKESEEVFLDPDSYAIKDEKHSVLEDRFVIVGETVGEWLLAVAFTVRRRRIRIISARPANRREREKYEQDKKNAKI